MSLLPSIAEFILVRVLLARGRRAAPADDPVLLGQSQRELRKNLEELALVLRFEQSLPVLRPPQEARQPGEEMVEKPRQAGVPDNQGDEVDFLLVDGVEIA